MEKTIIHNAEIVNEGSTFHGYVTISGEFIENVAAGNPSRDVLDGCGTQIDAAGKLLLPGAIDDQVHFRDPGFTHKADMASESRAAIAGGVTSFMDMPNTNPQTVTIEALEAKWKRAAEVSLANYSFYIGATNDNIQTLKSVDYSRVCGVKVFLGSSTGNMLVDNRETLRRIFAEVPALVAIHSEDEAIITANKAAYVRRFGNDLPVCFHPLIRSAEACCTSTGRAIKLARECGTRLHVLHLSTAGEMKMLDAGDVRAKKITGEVCVHHLWFTDNDYAALGNRIKCNPAIKTCGDRAALRAALRDDRLDVVATDHAPHLLAEKQGNCLTAASGAPLVQYSLVAMLEMARQGIFSREKVVEKMCHAPAELFRVEKRGYLRPGYYADVVLVEQDARNRVTAQDVLSKCGWSPFEGTVFHHRVAATFVNGSRVYENGIFDDTPRGRQLKFRTDISG